LHGKSATGPRGAAATPFRRYDSALLDDLSLSGREIAILWAVIGAIRGRLAQLADFCRAFAECG
jgi:hypothetical protein